MALGNHESELRQGFPRNTAVNEANGSASPDSEGEVRTGGTDNLPPLNEVRQIKDLTRGGEMITHIDGVALRSLVNGHEFVIRHY